ncbi:Lrp/AsnC family transcriptional regulator, regulator for asnA, asnC and gidA [Arthrobacter sp. cf158]|uniref:Lrp/AsnC family transcriptional regulator n=1 Tax=Arthrobacter sp. cf158 TaxID=1761744 RepID=UPI00089D1298|nr:Lrp/AsnC family transcriptional regulator [Arthrobacter sp. cf158]SDW87161.1 Lrp/AsnC family transcriptional regulator, regulator for asnA, asnC and gidA [Arthrobacter sp. cf158]
MEQLDTLDRQILAALVRNGRAPWRLIAEVLGQQERTVARRGNKLLESGVVRINAFVNPMAVSTKTAFLLRLKVTPRYLRSACSWLADLEESAWVSGLAGSNEGVAELFLPNDGLAELLYERLADIDGVQSFTMTPLFDYFRTPSGWRPDVLDSEQYDALHNDEDGRLARPLGHHGPLDETNLMIARHLQNNGRAAVDEIASELGVSKATVSRRLDTMTGSGALFIRAVLDLNLFGFPLESLLTISCAGGETQKLGEYLAGLSVTRWAAASGDQLHAQVAAATMDDLRILVNELHGREGVVSARSSMFAEVFKRSTLRYRSGLPEAPTAALAM